MKIVKWLLGVIVAVVLVLVVVASMLPDNFEVSRSVVINAPADKVYPLLATPAEWKRWSIWNERDPAMQITYSGPAAGMGTAWDWKSKSQGNGGMSFTQAKPNQSLDYELHFEGMNPSTGVLQLEPASGGTKVTWVMRGSANGQLVTKLFLPFMGKMIGPDFEAGLKNLKKLAEQA
jgi:uncharacterized protein YndB with AHSA1/START domain